MNLSKLCATSQYNKNNLTYLIVWGVLTSNITNVKRNIPKIKNYLFV